MLRSKSQIDSFQIREGERLSWFLVTEAVAGETLDHRLERGWRPTDEVVWQIAEQLLEILDYLHSQDPPLVHRDLKPSNVLITPDNQVWLIDFGAVQSRLWAQGGGGSTIIGTFGYMAPEQFSGQAFPQSDLYGLGATLIRLLSRRHPIEIPLEGTGLHFQPFVSCPPFYLAWLSKLLQPLYSQRFASATEALSLLHAATADAPEARQWLQQQTQQVSEISPAGRRKRLLPSRIRLDQVGRFLSDSESLTVSTEGEQLHIYCSEDQQLRARLRALDQLNFFPREPENQAQVPAWRGPLKDTNGTVQGQTSTLFWVLGAWGSMLSFLPGMMLLTGGHALIGALILLLPISGWTGAALYAHTRQKRRAHLQTTGAVLPVLFEDYFPAFSSRQPLRPKASLLTNACLSADARGLRLRYQPPGETVYPESFALLWSDISELALQPWLSEYPHWDHLLDRRLYQLSIRTVRPQPAYPETLWGTGSSPKNHAPPDNLRLSLSESDAESLLQILQGLRRQYIQGSD